MAVDVSPDGRRIVFDLLGDIYVMPISGGEATLLRGGPAYEVQPRFSPDGGEVSFTSDRGGLDNLWIMNADGSNPRQISTEEERQVSDAVWTPDGMYLIGRKYPHHRRHPGRGIGSEVAAVEGAEAPTEPTIDGAKLLDDMAEVFRGFVIPLDGQPTIDALALRALYTHVYDEFSGLQT